MARTKNPPLKEPHVVHLPNVDKYTCLACHTKPGHEGIVRNSMVQHIRDKKGNHAVKAEARTRRLAERAAAAQRVQRNRRPHPSTLVEGTSEPPAWDPEPSPPPTLRSPSPFPYDQSAFDFLKPRPPPAARTAEDIARDLEWARQDGYAEEVAYLDRMRHREEFGGDSDCGSEVSATAEELAERDDDLQLLNKMMQAAQEEYWPFENGASALLHLLDSCPRTTFSSRQLKMIIAMLKAVVALKTKDIPSYDSFRKTQKAVAELVHGQDAVVQMTSRLGNHFTIANPLPAFAKDFSNPAIAREIVKYPEVGPVPVTDVAQARRWHGLGRTQLNPMWADDDNNHFYIDEIAQCRNGRLVMPLKWVTVIGVVHAECLLLERDPQTSAIIIPKDESHSVRIPASELWKSYIQLKPPGSVPFRFSETSGPVPQMPHPTRIAACGDPVYVIYVSVWADDVSGNNSKQYNKHVCVYATNGNLPGKLLSQEYCIKYLSSSKYARVSEQMEAILEYMKGTSENPVITFDAVKQRQCRLIIRVADLPCDNPQADELASHIHNGKDRCRRGKLGGMDAGETIEDRETDEMYEALHDPCAHRTVEDIKDALDEQTEVAILTGRMKDVEALNTSSGIKDHFAGIWHAQICAQHDIIARQLPDPPPVSRSNPKKDRDANLAQILADRETRLRDWVAKQPGDKYNPLLYVAGLNPAAHTAVEILHTYLLGIVKYVWHFVNRHLAEKKTHNLFVQRLASSDCSALKAAGVTASYIWRYKDGLNGKHFKMLSQTMVFHLHDLVPAELFALVREVSILGGLLWRVRIDNMAEYKEHLSISIGNMLDAFDSFRPRYIQLKIKLHCFAHLPDDIEEFGPAIRKSTETFESFNKVWRNGCFLSNRHADSRDIAIRMTRSTAISHLAGGGYVYDKQTGKWRQGGGYLRDVLKDHPILARGIALVREKVYTPGHIKKVPSPPGVERWCVVARDTGDLCKVEGWVVYGDRDNSLRWGRISGIKRDKVGGLGVVTVRSYRLGADRHPNLQMPLLSDSGDDHDVPSKMIRFAVSVQHDCAVAGCDTTGERAIVQERRVTALKENVYSHKPDGHYVLNLAAMHNIDNILSTLPADLRYPRQTQPDRKAHHRRYAEEARKLGREKRAAGKEKGDRTRANTQARKNKEKAAEMGAGQPEVAAEDEPMPDARDDEEEGSGNEEENDPEEDSDEEGEAGEVAVPVVPVPAVPTRMRIRVVGAYAPPR